MKTCQENSKENVKYLKNEMVLTKYKPALSVSVHYCTDFSYIWSSEQTKYTLPARMQFLSLQDNNHWDLWCHIYFILYYTNICNTWYLFGYKVSIPTLRHLNLLNKLRSDSQCFPKQVEHAWLSGVLLGFEGVLVTFFYVI